MPLRVKFAVLLAFVLHGVLILTGGYRLSYDVYNHLFFADHYLKDWWSLWEPRWYTGFTVVSYPPLVHQLIALLGRVIGVDAALALLLWVVLCAYPVAIYFFSRIFTGKTAASYAAIGAALLPSLYYTAHTFGQVPTLVSTLFVLCGAVALADGLKQGRFLSLALAVALFTTAMAAHHATLLLQPLIAATILLHAILEQNADRRQILRSFTAFAILTAFFAWLVIWPFWDWGRGQELQVTIDHLSRHNFIKDPLAALLFFLPEYGLFIPLIPIGIWLGLRKRYWGLGVALLLSFLLGLGGTTPLPRILFGKGWAWLTYERFAFWASLMLLPFFGLVATLFMRREKTRRTWPYMLGLLALICLVIGFIPSWLPTQPKQLDMQPIVDFLAQNGRARYRYLTFGFGDQLAYLSRLTDATTIDGSYHTARSLPELRQSGIGQIDSAFWFPGGMAALDPILEKSSERGVRWGFVNLRLYDPALVHNGWIPTSTLSNGVEVWENPNAILPPPVQAPDENPLAAFSWGVLPLTAFFITTLLALRRYWPAISQRFVSAVIAASTGLLPLGLTFWYYRTIAVIEQQRIYFTYSNALFFLCDGFVVAAVLAWLINRPPHPTASQPVRLSILLASPENWLIAICILASLSTFWSLEWRTSVYISLHLWLCLAFYFVLRDTPQAWRWFSLGCCAALVLQVTIGYWEFVSQSTAIALRLGLDWPGSLTPNISGASVVQIANGTRWLRAYGTMPHPNLLGGFAVAMLVGPLAIYLTYSKRWLLALILINLTLALIVLTFSRSAWLGLIVLAIGMFWFRKRLETRRLVLLILTSLATLSILPIYLWQLFQTRLGAAQAQVEQVSSYTRYWLVQRAMEIFAAHPWLGSGVGAFSLALSRHVADYFKIEPVHNIPLLVLTELGVVGIILLGGLLVALIMLSPKILNPEAITFFSGVMGLIAISQFDHYLWTLAPGRLLLASLLGLLMGQVRTDASSS